MQRGKLISIGSTKKPLEELPVNNDLVYRALEKINAHPLFSGSAILRRFLFYVVNETLAGNARQIKEYTIALHVLNKPINFDVQKDGIVRIHACRLRKTLENYYRTAGSEDGVFILIPKGRYIPTFHLTRPMMSDSVYNMRYINAHNTTHKEIPGTVIFYSPTIKI